MLVVHLTTTTNTMANSCHNVHLFLIVLLVQSHRQSAKMLRHMSLPTEVKHVNMVLRLLLLLLMLLLMQLLLLLQLMLIILWMLLHQLLDYPFCNSTNAAEPCNYLTTASSN